jgi:hypothetical protein
VAILLLALLWTGGAPAATDPELQAAREELRLRAETERRMRRDFESLLADGKMTAAEIADFEDYLLGLGMLVNQQRRTVAKLEGAGSEHGIGAPGSEPLPADFNRGQTGEEKVALLDAELGTSLSAFDEKLLREQKEISEKSRAASTGDAASSKGSPDASSDDGGEGQGQGSEGQDAHESENSGGESASGSAEAGGQSGQETGERGESGEKGDVAGKGQEGGEQVASAGGPGDAGGQAGNTNVPPDIPDGKDDDVVARQLREAAESEQDPELREKLWDEYRRYKSSTQ